MVCCGLRVLRIFSSSYGSAVALQICLILLTSIQVAAQGDLNALLDQARTWEKAGDYAAAARVYVTNRVAGSVTVCCIEATHAVACSARLAPDPRANSHE